MLKDYQTKDIKNSDEPKKKSVQFNFPEHGVTVEAENLEEAQEKLKKLTKQ